MSSIKETVIRTFCPEVSSSFGEYPLTCRAGEVKPWDSSQGVDSGWIGVSFHLSSTLLGTGLVSMIEKYSEIGDLTDKTASCVLGVPITKSRVHEPNSKYITAL
ncbi:hypothetical protein RRG08_030957 [Elysia crispata]|uniref:Uncharacterized protein n=1 Tax=Elysia crispata TaxID=231223 RepID=A0AAE1ACJ1_9GAST|nr:hypothetical protein RRG08_030957 [Elysia crispata]